MIHGFGLSTKLQEVAVMSKINLTLMQILSFNVGVEFGQILVLVIVFPLLSLIRNFYFEKISKLVNSSLVILGIYLMVFQLNGYFSNHSHEHENIVLPKKSNHDHHHDHSHDEDHHHHHSD